MLDEEGNVAPLVEAVREALADAPPWELILVDDGSSDGTLAAIREMGRADPRVRPVSLARNYGQSTAMQAGFDQARGEVIVTMDGDLQNDPSDVPMLVDKLAEGYDLVAGYRIRRRDRLVTRKIPSWIANAIIGWLTGVPIRDNGCSLKAYKGDLIRRMRLYSDMHRFIPALAAGTAGARIVEVGVRHRARVRGKSKYGLSRVVRVLADLMTIKMIRTFRLRPLALYAVLAAAAAAVATAGLAVVSMGMGGVQGVAPPSLVFTGVFLLWYALAVFLLMLGLVGEVAIRQHRIQGRKIVPLTRERSVG